MDRPDVPRALALCQAAGLQADPARTSYFLGRETLIPTPRPPMGPVEARVFTFLSPAIRPRPPTSASRRSGWSSSARKSKSDRMGRPSHRALSGKAPALHRGPGASAGCWPSASSLAWGFGCTAWSACSSSSPVPTSPCPGSPRPAACLLAGAGLHRSGDAARRSRRRFACGWLVELVCDPALAAWQSQRLGNRGQYGTDHRRR